MPATLTWYKDHYLLKYSGVVDFSEVIQVYGEIVASERLDEIDWAIVDVRDLETIDYSGKVIDSVGALSKAASTFRDRIKIGVIVNSSETEEIIRELVERINQDFQHDWERRIFYDYDEAQAWASS